MSSTTTDVSPVATNGAARTRGWAALGLAAALGSSASVFLSMMLSPEYVEGAVITAEQINAGLVEKRFIAIAFHVVTLASALLLVVFAAGLGRRLRATLPSDSLAPAVASAGLLLVAAAQILGTGLDTEFLFGVDDTAINLPSDIGFYSHWIATIPWLWAGGGIAALAVGAARRSGAVPRWLGAVSIVLGSLTVLVALSPLQYMAALPGVAWLFTASLGFLVGDRLHRGGGVRRQ